MLSFKQFISEEIDLERRKESKNRARSAYMDRQAKPHPDILDHYNNWRASTPDEKKESGIKKLDDYHASIQNVPEGHPLYGHKIPIIDSYKRMDGVVPFGRAPKKEVTPRPPPFPHKEEWVKDALQSHDSTSRPTLEGYRVAMNSHEGNTNELEANKRDVLRAIKHHEITWPKPKIEKPKIEKPKIKKPKITDEQFMNSHNKMPDHWSFSQRSSALNNEYRKQGLSTSSGSYQKRLKKILGKTV